MLKNYFKVAYRSLVRYKFFTIINVIGLAVGMSISLVLLAVVADIYDYDQFHENKDNIYRITTKTYDQNRIEEYATSPAPVAALVGSYPEVQEMVRMDNSLYGDVNYKEKKLPMSGFFVDPNFFDVFSFKLLQGNPKTALSQPNNLLITASEAKKLFSEEDPMGKAVSIAPYGDFIITGILEDHPKKSHIRYDLIGSYDKFLSLENQKIIPAKTNQWANLDGHYTYLQLKDDTSPANLEAALEKIGTEQPWNIPSLDITLQLQAMESMAFGELRRSPGPQWDYISMVIFLVLVLMILVPACFNYANLSIARSFQRAKEIGIRKVVGSHRNQVFLQFIVETMLVCLLAFAIAYEFFTYLRDGFLSILAPASSAGLTLELSPTMIVLFVLFVLLTGFLMGVIPALHFSKIQPLQALKSKLSTRASGKVNVRKALLVVQFAFSLGFIMAVAIVIEQYRYSINYQLGFEKENILNVNLQNVDHEQWKTQAGKLAEVDAIAQSSDIVGAGMNNYTWIQQVDQSDSMQVFQMFADQQYLPMHEIPLVAGENFPQQMPHEESFVVVNEEFVNKMGYANQHEALGKRVALENGREVSIIGVVKNFNYSDLRQPIKPFFFRYDPEQFVYANIKLLTTNVFATQKKLENTWESMSDQQFEATFLSTQIEEAYQWYFAFVKMTGFLGFLAISISVLGLLGMVVFNVGNRTKEVGIRKIHGATSRMIVVLLSKDYLQMMIIASFIAVPITYLLFNTMMPLIQYYSADISISTILISIVGLFAIGTLTVASQTFKAAQTNPADTLRHE